MRRGTSTSPRTRGSSGIWRRGVCRCCSTAAMRTSTTSRSRNTTRSWPCSPPRRRHRRLWCRRLARPTVSCSSMRRSCGSTPSRQRWCCPSRGSRRVPASRRACVASSRRRESQRCSTSSTTASSTRCTWRRFATTGSSAPSSMQPSARTRRSIRISANWSASSIRR